MSRRVVAAVLFSCALPVFAQTVSEGGALGALLAEVRLLREAIERQSAVASRAQLLVGKLALQDQRVLRWQAESQRLESELAALSQGRAVQLARAANLRNEMQGARNAEL